MAYGHVPAPKRVEALDVRVHRIPARKSYAAIATIPFECANGDGVPVALQQKLCNEFNDELTKGITYPQRGPMSIDEFLAYFLSYDLIVGVFITQAEADQLIGRTFTQDDDDLQSAVSKEIVSQQQRDWTATYAFSYYIKPNYPGRSSHLCNAGFVVSPLHRGLGLGSIAGRSFLHYGPKAGYRGSVFNLVYVNNVASVRIWERLGFTRVGRIPQAGLLKKQPSSSDADAGDVTQEEFVDAWVIHGDFEKLGRRGLSALPTPTTNN